MTIVKAAIIPIHMKIIRSDCQCKYNQQYCRTKLWDAWETDKGKTKCYNMITYETIIMSRSNKTSEWRKNLSPEKRSLMMKWARESASKQFQPFEQLRIELAKAKNEKWLDKIDKTRKKECRNRLLKGRLCEETKEFGGFWLKEEQIDAKLAEMKTDSEKRAALKCQLHFRQKVISVCPSHNRKLFSYQKKVI